MDQRAILGRLGGHDGRTEHDPRRRQSRHAATPICFSAWRVFLTGR